MNPNTYKEALQRLIEVRNDPASTAAERHSALEEALRLKQEGPYLSEEDYQGMEDDLRKANPHVPEEVWAAVIADLKRSDSVV